MGSRKKAKNSIMWCFFLLVAIIFTMAYLPPYFKHKELEQEYHRLNDQLTEIQAKKANLNEYKQFLLSDAYIEQVARHELGLVRPGEVVIMRALPGKALPLERPGSGYEEIRD